MNVRSFVHPGSLERSPGLACFCEWQGSWLLPTHHPGLPLKVGLCWHQVPRRGAGMCPNFMMTATLIMTPHI